MPNASGGSARLAILTATIIVVVLLAAVHSSAQSESLAVRQAETSAIVSGLEHRMTAIEAVHIEQRMTRLETILESSTFYTRLILGAIVAMLAERVWGILVAVRRQRGN